MDSLLCKFQCETHKQHQSHKQTHAQTQICTCSYIQIFAMRSNTFITIIHNHHDSTLITSYETYSMCVCVLHCSFLRLIINVRARLSARVRLQSERNVIIWNKTSTSRHSNNASASSWSSHLQTRNAQRFLEITHEYCMCVYVCLRSGKNCNMSTRCTSPYALICRCCTY